MSAARRGLACGLIALGLMVGGWGAGSPTATPRAEEGVHGPSPITVTDPTERVDVGDESGEVRGSVLAADLEHRRRTLTDTLLHEGLVDGLSRQERGRVIEALLTLRAVPVRDDGGVVVGYLAATFVEPWELDDRIAAAEVVVDAARGSGGD